MFVERWLDASVLSNTPFAYNFTVSPETDAATETQLLATMNGDVAVIVLLPVESVKTELCRKNSQPIDPVNFDAITFFPIKLLGRMKPVSVIESV